MAIHIKITPPQPPRTHSPQLTHSTANWTPCTQAIPASKIRREGTYDTKRFSLLLLWHNGFRLVAADTPNKYDICINCISPLLCVSLVRLNVSEHRNRNCLHRPKWIHINNPYNRQMSMYSLPTSMRTIENSLCWCCCCCSLSEKVCFKTVTQFRKHYNERYLPDNEKWDFLNCEYCACRLWMVIAQAWYRFWKEKKKAN